MTRRSQLLVVAVFVVAVSFPAVLSVAGVLPENLENRSATAMPEMRAGSIVDDDFYVGLAGYLTDRLPLRDKIIKANAEIDRRFTLTDPFDPERPRGRDGWLYHADTLVDECPGPPPPSFLDQGDAFDHRMRDADIPFLYIVAPDKVSIYPEHMPVEGVAGLLGLTGDEAPACNRLWDTSLSEAAADHDWLVPLADEIRAERGGPAEPLYYQIDTHWTDSGALHLVEAMVDGLQPGLWDPDAVQPTVPDQKRADSSILRGEQSVEQVPGFLVDRPGVTTTYDRTPIGSEEDGFDVTRSSSTDAPLIEGTTVLVGDSFGRHAMELLAPYFEELIWVHRTYLLAHDFSDVVDEPPTAVVLQLVQRSMAKGWWSTYFDSVTAYLDDD